MITEKQSIINNLAKDGKYKNCTFTTCRKFKGLEAEIVILLDVDENTFEKEIVDEDENRMLFYVGTSRAKQHLHVITSLTNEQCVNILTNQLDVKKKIKNGKKELANKLNSVPLIVE